MNILILNWRDIEHPLSGGAEISLFEQARYWIKNGAQVTWFSSSFKNAKAQEKVEGIRILRVGSHYTVHIFAFIFYLLGRFRNFDIVVDCFHFVPFFSPLYFRKTKIIALINEPAKDVWFKNIFFPVNLVGYVSEPLFFVPYRSKQFITGSDSVGKDLSKSYKIPKENIHVIHHGVTVWSSPAEIKKNKIPTVIYASTISRDKGIEDALSAIAEFRKKRKGVQFWVIGKTEDKRYFEKIKERVKKLGLWSITRFFGFVTEEKKFELLTRAWVLIHPSIREGWGLNVIEAASMGTPTVGYKVMGLVDSVIQEETGILTEVNPTALARGLERLIFDRKLYNSLSKNAVLWSKRFSWEKAGCESWDLIMQVHKQS